MRCGQGQCDSCWLRFLVKVQGSRSRPWRPFDLGVSGSVCMLLQHLIWVLALACALVRVSSVCRVGMCCMLACNVSVCVGSMCAQCMMCVQHVHSMCAACAWHVCSMCVACAQCVHGMCVVCVWHVHGVAAQGHGGQVWDWIKSGPEESALDGGHAGRCCTWGDAVKHPQTNRDLTKLQCKMTVTGGSSTCKK